MTSDEWSATDEEIESATVAAPSGAAEPDDLDDRTVIAPRVAQPRYSLVMADGQSLALTADEVILGRRPTADPERPGAQLLAVPDGTKTTSKNHAYLRREGDSWSITDLASTNGVATFGPDGAETVLQSGAPTVITGDFALGQARMRIAQES